MVTLKKWLRRLRTLIWTAVALVIIGAAVLVGIGKLLMPYSERFKPRLEAVLAEQFNQPVRLESFTGEWKAFGPRISLEGVELLGGPAGEGAMAIQRAALDIKPLNAIVSDRPLYTFRIIGADLALLRTDEGQLELSGLGLSGRQRDADGEETSSSALANLARVGEIRLQESRFSFSDPSRELNFQLKGIDGRLQLSGDRLAAEVQASVTDERRGLVLGDLSATVKTVLEDGRRIQELEFHLETGEVMMDELAAQLPEHRLKPVSGRVNAQLWGDWAPGAPIRLAGVVDLRDAGLDTGETALHIDRLNARLQWRWRDRTQWRIDLADVRMVENGRDWTAPRVAVERNLEGNVSTWVGADYIETEFPLEAVQVFMKELNSRWPKGAPTASRGPIRDFDLVINGNRKLGAASGAFEDLDLLAWGPWPLPRGISGRVDLAYGEGSLRFGGQGVEIHWARNFQEPLLTDIQDCELEILWDDSNHWQVDALPCVLDSDPLELEARVRFVKDEGRPRVDVNADIRRADLAGLRDYWPEDVIKPKVTDWLRRSLVAGEVTGGRFVMQGDMDRFPFRNGEGTLLAVAELADVRMNYAPGWPAAIDLDATARLDGSILTADGRIGDLAGATVQTASARIDDLQAPVLQLTYDSETRLPLLQGFLEASPLLRNTSLDFDRFGLEGPARAGGTVRLPLGPGRGEVAVNGLLEVTDAAFFERSSGLRLEGLTGLVGYDREGAMGEGLAVTLDGWPATLGLRAAWGAPRPFEASLSGRFPASLLVAQTPLVDDPLLARIDGEAEWNLALTVDHGEPADGSEVWLEVRSDLADVRMALPAPLEKPAGVRWPLRLHYPLESRDPVLRGDIERRLSVVLELPSDEDASAADDDAPPEPLASDTPADAGSLADPGTGEATMMASGVETTVGDTAPGLVRGAVSLGGVPARLPASGRFALGGLASRLDLDEWVSVIVDYARARRYPGGLSLEAVDLFADELVLLNRRFEEVALDLTYTEGQLDVGVAGASIAGDFRYLQNEDGTQSLSAQLDRLWLPAAEDEGVTMETDPRLLPEMRFYVQDFQYLGLDLGETRIEAYPIADGLHIETVDAASEQLSFEARGDWVVTDDGGQQSDFDILLTSESLGGIISALDLSSVLEGGQTMVRYDAWWPGPPAAFELARLNGQMTFSVVDGRILNADPGAGRVLGLMSLGALPRRLALDFSDVFESGFGFDQASGTVRLEGGVAFTDDFVLESTAAQLTITGSSDLQAKEFDYLMSVKPGVSQALPVLGAIAAGPAGVAAGIALQELLREALGDAAEARYEISGPWSDPEVQRLESTPGPLAEPPPDPATENSTAQAQTREGP